MDGIAATTYTEVNCAACGAGNAENALFCARCTAPLAVTSLHELDNTDLDICRTALLEVLAESSKPPTWSVSKDAIDEGLWRAYLSAFWLRPETALILYAEAMAVTSLQDVPRGPWLDLGCGDGVHAALTGGWRFGGEFDVFQSLDLSAKDIYHHWNERRFRVDVSRRGRTIDYGIDIKPTAAARARALGILAHVECGDARRLPLADRSIGTIFSNMLRDLGQPLAEALRECRRVLKDDGVLLLSAMTPVYAGSLYFLPAARKAEASGQTNLARRLLRLDRGRSMFCQRQLSVPQWQELLTEQRLKVVDVRPMVAPQMIRFWDVGLRPFSMALLRQRQKWIDAGILNLIKPSVVNLIASQLQPLLENLNSGEVHCMNLLVVRKA